ncbi:hypothetical protein FEM54_28470 [Pseudomonas edaphica]|uniref:Uncharacterized protein n=1 Tax=Pseudomonas edaphica TaxID=2006980 RepID=A0A5R8QQ61_9PSED|nr:MULTISPECIES: hypothetical protein [Pseudomonas]NMX57043.1 hypothetical protein [Pseudomonas sp. WS 5146]NMX75442.1 hypothetical protein [Pseudomonas sp. WS 5532]NVZ54821.1 hypothetical protein [Pseudomonas edaphica]NWC46516.1 hypothetical protein [Pseudomonas sp. IPO3747]NWE09908.1 hypothetical protein [Pseudomonas edaphica]
MSRMPPFSLLLAMPLLLMGCATPPKPTSEQLAVHAFETPEYFSANALPIVKASTLYAQLIPMQSVDDRPMTPS